ncbi:gluconeogenesis factor YvcK family protein [Sphaerobacter sp.]|uniref:gluconeogenesis factor YvcK family protein n=1 Tax=Sphaerobacter sp. TaxID=2099654 RepID=UPI001DD22F71|nr:gluconeogenesis factor YvcK family protein [Sphaerobacter sp.]MBX5446740.1 YvcK family protein [Sphaerobacter sp.]
MRQRIDERIVTIGGGTGSYTMLSELRKVATNLWAIVTMMDSGGSSRRLIDEFGRPLPLGDLRQALVALSRASALWRELFNYRFPEFPDATTQGVGGHALGNLILHALQDLNDGDLLGAIEDAEELLRTNGHVIPVTLDQSTLCAELSDGTVIRGEAAIDRPEGRPVLPIRRIFLDPPVRATLRARKALERADKILIGPGDLYTSVLPCLLVEGVAEAIRASDGEVIYICNVMTKHGETDGFAASDFVREVHRYLGRRVDAVVVNTGDYPPELLARYAAERAEPVRPDLDAVRALVPRVLTGPVAQTERLIRHDAERVILTIWPELAA